MTVEQRPGKKKREVSRPYKDVEEQCVRRARELFERRGLRKDQDDSMWGHKYA